MGNGESLLCGEPSRLKTKGKGSTHSLFLWEEGGEKGSELDHEHLI